jgi:hypothetical protein
MADSLVRVDCAVYGAAGSGHALLASSITRERIPPALAGLVDRPPHHPEGTLPLLACAPIEGFYAIWRTLDDPLAARAGMVRSHVAILDLESAGDLSSIGTIVEWLPSEITAEPFANAFDIERDGTANPIVNSRYESLCDQLVRADRSGPVVVPDEGDWEAMLTTLWWFLWPEARRRLACFHANGPEAVPSTAATILVSPRAATNKWGGYAMLGASRTPSEAAKLLAGTANTALSRLRGELRTLPSDLRSLGLVERTAGLLERAGSTTSSVTELKMLLEAVVRLAPGADSAMALKASTVQRLALLLRHASTLDVLALSNLDVDASGVALQILQDALRAWVLQHVARSEAKDACTLVKRLADVRFAAWWRGAMRDGLRTVLLHGALSTWEAIWSWSVIRPEVFAEISAEIEIGDDAEPLAARACPRGLPSATATAAIAFARGHAWPRVHAAVVASAYPAPQALKLQLAFPQRPRDGLAVLLDRLDGRDLVELSLSSSDDEILRRGAGVLIAAPGLLAELDVTSSAWRSLWLRALTNGLSPWAGVREPTSVAEQLLQEAARGEPVEPMLLVALSSNLPRVARIPAGLWDSVKEPARSALARGVAAQWLESIGGAGKPNLDRAVVPAAAELFAKRVSERTVSIELLPRILDVTNERSFVARMLEAPSVPVPASVAREVGARIVRWKDSTLAADGFVRWRRGWRELEPLVIECVALLPLWDRLLVPTQQAPSDEDVRALMSELRRMLADLYPEGPSAHLWVDAGGKASTLPLASTGDERWAVALEHMGRRAPGVPRFTPLIEVVRSEYPEGDHADRLAIIERWLARR